MACSATSLMGDRIRRNGDDPVLEMPHFRSRAAPIILHDREHSELRYRRSRWQGDPDLLGVEERTLEARLFVNGCHAGSFKLTEVRPEPLISNDQFFDWADALSDNRVELAEIILGHWADISEVSDYGTILELSRAWMHPLFSNGRRFALAANALVALSTQWSLLVLKAFPLEYEQQAGDQYAQAQTRRVRAMIRHYRSTLGVEPFPGLAGDEGWMYAMRANLSIAGPSPNARCDDELP